jgi:hypothetical protein
MVLGIGILVTIGLVLWTIMRRVTYIHNLIETNIQRFSDNSADVAMEIGSKMANVAVKKVKEAFNKNNS